MARVSIFANPVSGRGRGRKLAEQLKSELTPHGYGVDLFFQRADELDREQLNPDSLAAIVIGGDGTLRAVVSRLYVNCDTRRPPLLIIPTGTANLMGKHLGIRWNEAKLGEQITHTLRQGNVMHLDMAIANGEPLLLVAGVGLDGRIVHELTRRRSGPITYFSYALPAMTALQSFDYPSITVTVDDRRVFGPQRGMVFIGNVAEYGTGFPILPLADPTDGLLDVCALPCASPEELVNHAIRVAVGEHIHGEGVVYLTGKRILVESPSPVPVQVDGEAAGHTPLFIEMQAKTLPFLVPSL